MTQTRVKTSLIIENQVPSYVRDEFPLFVEFLSQYYRSLEYQSGPSDILQNIDRYVKLENLTNLIDSTSLSADVEFFDTTISVDSTSGFPDSYGLLLINNEIITYESKTSTTFVNCIRGFVGTTSYQDPANYDQLVFSDSEVAEHSSGETVTNLSVLFLKEFFTKVKKQVAPGFEVRELYSELNESFFITRIKDFYSSKGSDKSFKILFSALYGESVSVIKPRDYLIQPSDAQYYITKDHVVEVISGDPMSLSGSTLIQDETDFIDAAKRTISKVERILRGEKEYYIISLDYDQEKDVNVSDYNFGEFTIHPKTQIVTTAGIGVTTLDVDSTAGFPESGTLTAVVANDTTISITYSEKTLNQFLGCSGVTSELSASQEIALDVYAYGVVGISTDNVVKVRITGVLSDLQILDDNYYQEKNDIIQIKTLGSKLDSPKANNWFFNVPVRYDVKSLELLDISNFTYKVNLFDEHDFIIGDSITLISSDSREFYGSIIPENITSIFTSNVSGFDNKTSFNISGQGQLNTSSFYTVRKNISKVSTTNYAEIERFSSNIQNIYTDLDDSLYLASNSLPTYFNRPLTITDRAITFSGTFSGTQLVIGTHGLLTGDAIVYNPTDSSNKLNLIKGIYFVRRINSTTISLARSRQNIYTQNYISITGTVTNNKFFLFEFSDRSLNLERVKPQKLIRKLSTPINDGLEYETEGHAGIFVNGVELSNYKSSDLIYYGSILRIVPTSPGSGYDLMSPPVLSISDDLGTGAVAICTVTGTLNRVDIVDPGFDYLEDPIITITGGGGTGAIVKPNLIEFDHSVTFNSSVSSSQVNTTNDTIGFGTFHKFRDSEEVIYDTQGESNVGGITTGAKYYVSVQNGTTIKLHNTFTDASVGINTINLSSFGTGNHRFLSVNKKKKIGSVSIIESGTGYVSSGSSIQLTIKGRIGVSTLTGQNFNAVLKPIFRGEINSVSVISGGSEYGDEEILNYQRQPTFTLNSGSGAQLVTVVSDGKIKQVFVTNNGSGYNSPPDLVINSTTGSGAVLTPIINNGQLVEVKVIFEGNGYLEGTDIDVIPAGSGALFEASLTSWRVDTVQRLLQSNQIPSDDGILQRSLKDSYGLQYTHSYAARSLRISSLATQFIAETPIFVSDLQTSAGAEIESSTHSPIIGWAYDGNPIYGPYGFDSSGIVKRMVSGYTVSLNPDRPSTLLYPSGYFVEDYVFTNSGDLDEHNGKFGPTPEFPDGVYAYFAAINSINDSTGPFASFRRPVFPYIIGNTYKSKPIAFNYLASSNQDEIDINAQGWSRNTYPYHFTNARSYYDFVIDSNRIKKQLSIVKNTTRSGIDSIGIVTGGTNYQIGDQIVFDNTGTGGFGISAEVSFLEGKEVNNVGIATSVIAGVQMIPASDGKQFIGYATNPHTYNNNDLITFASTGISTSGKIKVVINELLLSTGVGSTGYTGIVTYFNVNGNLNVVKENDIYQILGEQVKILNVDTLSSRVRVLRSYNDTQGITTIAAGVAITERTRRFELPFGISTSTFNLQLNKQIYFDPKETVGLGTSAGPGIGYSLSFTNPGAGITQINIPTRALWIPKHGLETGTELIYADNGGTAVSISTDGVSSYQLSNNSSVYVARLGDNLIGISTIKVGLGTTGSFVGIATTASLLYFTNVGTGNSHSFTTNYQNTLKGTTTRNLVTVSLAATHGLEIGDSVKVSVLPGVVTSLYSGTYDIVSTSSTQFAYTILSYPEASSYSSSNGELKYQTTSGTAYGPIHQSKLKSKGLSYRTLPYIKSITTGIGTNAVLVPYGTGIGSINRVEIQDIGFDYPSDLSLRPTAKIPEILEVNNLFSIKSIGVTSVGRNYIVAPDLIVIDRLTREIDQGVDLEYNLGDTQVSILKNSKSVNKETSIVFPINNSNGVGISTIRFISASKDVVVTLGSSFSNAADFPFAIGDKILIENISVGIGSTAKGYNSEAYGYESFTVVNIDPNIGGIGATVSYNLTGRLSLTEIPGNYDPINSAGRIIAERDLPSFSIEYQRNEFFDGENVFSQSSTGVIENWDENNNTVRVSTSQGFVKGDTLVGESSKTEAIINRVISFDSIYDVKSSSIVKKGWQQQTGFLNNDLQKIADNDYYQYFSYSIKTNTPFSNWDDVVDDLNHPAGFKKFADLQVVSSPDSIGIGTTAEMEISTLAELDSTIDTHCIFDFDLVTENNIFVSNRFASNQINFNSTILQDYFESIGNRVLNIDDLSPQFNSNPRSTPFSTIDAFTLSDNRYRKYITFVRDLVLPEQNQVLLTSLLHDSNFGYLNQYGKIFNQDDLGTFDFSIAGTEGALVFYPVFTEENNYDISFSSINVSDVVASTGEYNLGDIVNIKSSTVTIPVGVSTATTIVGIASTYRASKVYVVIGATDGSFYEVDEISVLHNGTDVEFLEYGQLTTGNLSSFSSPGIGTYNAYLSGSNLNIDLTPDVGLSTAHFVNTVRVSIANSSAVGVGTTVMYDSFLTSTLTSIASSTAPGVSTVSQFSLTGDAAYYIAVVEDLTNQQYQMSELVSLKNQSNAYVSEFGFVQTDGPLGSFTIERVGDNTRLHFIPNANIDAQVRVFQQSVHSSEGNDFTREISLNNASIAAGNGSYEGTLVSTKKEFNLTSNQLPIFERYALGSDSSIVDLSLNAVKIPGHFFVTGEEISYEYTYSDTTSVNAIGIATTSVGVGTTDKLPRTIYAVKSDNLYVKFAKSAADALSTPAVTFDIASVGIGTSHVFRSKKQNAKTLISIDNVIQSPLVSTAVTTITSSFVGEITNLVTLSGITSFFTGDMIKIGNEIMLIETLGYGSTNVAIVQRGWLGTGIATHGTGSLITKLNGNYNIDNNIIYFSTAPYGQVPFTGVSDRGDEQDYVGLITGSTFSGRVFLKSGNVNSVDDTYFYNKVFDDISGSFNGSNSVFTLKSGGSNITGISTSNAIVLVNQIFQGPERSTGSVLVSGNYDLSESAGITSITFTGTQTQSYDINATSLPRSGIIVSVGSTAGFGYQPLVSAGGTAIVSVAGTIQSISIGNSGSGYRSGSQPTVRVGVITQSTGTPNITYVGVASIGTSTTNKGRIVSIAITNPGIGYTSSNPPLVVIDAPLSYSNIPLVYSSSSPTGFGSGATVDIVVGQGSSVINFEIKNTGYSYGQGQILTVGVGGTVGIPTNIALPFSEFQITVDRTFTDSFSGFSIGDLQVIDPLDSLFDGETTVFPLKINDTLTSIRARVGSGIDIQSTLLIFINDVLQVPGKGYLFSGGSLITFPEPPKPEDTSKILFYKGNGEVDVTFIDIIEPIEVGDGLTIIDDAMDQTQNERIVSEILSSNNGKTNTYFNPGLSLNQSLIRPVILCYQTQDKIIDGVEVGKNRVLYEPVIQPTTNIIQSVGVTSSVIFVESVKTFFDSANEYPAANTDPKKILITSQDTLVAAAATAVVSVAGTISSFVINKGGKGYSAVPEVTVSNPVGLGTTLRASGSATISNGVVTSIGVVNSGSGYTSTNPPQVLIEFPSVTSELITNVAYAGDFGVITGIKTTSVGVASTGIILDLFIPTNSFLRNLNINSVGIATTGVSGIQTGYYFKVSNSNVGNGVTSRRSDGTIVGFGSTFIDNIYEVAAVSIAQTGVPGIGLTYVAQVTVSLTNYNGLSGFGFSSFYGEYSWGRISQLNRADPKSFIVYNNGLAGISTSPTVQRLLPLKYRDYSS